MANEKSVLAVIRASRPSFRNNHDKTAFAVHASFLAAGYALTATGPPAFSDDALSSNSTDEVGFENWNERDGEYAFVYVNPENGGKKVLLKCLAVSDKLMVDVLADGASEPAFLEIDVGDYVAENGATNYSEQFKNFDKLVNKINSEILSKLEGSSAKTSSSSSQSRVETTDRSRGEINQPNPGSGFFRPVGPLFDPSGIVIPPVNPLRGDDRHPGPGSGVYPTWRDPHSGGGMLVGPDHPLFHGSGGVGGVGGEPVFPGGSPGVPPGARFDPYGPPGVPGFEPGRFTRQPRRPGGGTHPDLEHFGSSDFI